MDEGRSGSVWYSHKRGVPAWEMDDPNGRENLMRNRPE